MHDMKTEIDDLLGKMKLKEKIAQMYQTYPSDFEKSTGGGGELTGPVTGPEQNERINSGIMYMIGTILNSTSASENYRLQKQYLENNRLKIPLLFMNDIIHGFRTIFPIPLALACSWDTSLVEETAKAAALEGASSGIHVTFAPMADLVRDPRWGRVMESSGEDPYLNGEMAAAYVRGFQGSSYASGEHMASCVKHFAGYGAAEAGRDYNTVELSERTLREYYLPGYRAGIEAGAAMVMSSFNTYDGIPATGNKFLQRKILREEWGFQGILISDWSSLHEMIPHSAAENGNEAAKLAIEAGVDIEMVSTDYINYLENLILEGTVDEKLVDEAVRRILELKFKMGLFEDPYRYMKPENESKYHLCSAHRELSRKAAAQSMVLLKNTGILPLKKNTKSIALIGPFADNGSILGNWAARGQDSEAVTLKQGIAGKVGPDTVINTEKACDVYSEDIPDLEAAIQAAKNAEVVILALGEHQEDVGEGASRAWLDLPGQQQKLAEEIISLGKPTVLVLFNGRPLELKWYHEKMDAILEAWFPGTEGGNAAADILFGDANPSGKLTMSFPYTVGQVPVYYNCYNTGRPVTDEHDKNRYLSKYIDIPNKPFYPFGYGLSYTSFDYSGFKCSSSNISGDSTISVSVDVTNTGCMAGEEIVQMYIRDLYGSTVRPLLELKGYKKVFLAPGQMETVSFAIDESMLRFHTADMNYKSEPGRFKVFVGSSSEQLMGAAEFVLE